MPRLSNPIRERVYYSLVVRVNVHTVYASTSKVPVGSFVGSDLTAISTIRSSAIVRVSLHSVYASISKGPVGSFVGGDENPSGRLVLH